MKKPVTEICRIVNTAGEFEGFEFEQLERKVHLAPTLTGQVYAITGVASSDIDIVITDDWGTPRNKRDVQVIIASKKRGKYDGKERDRLLFRRFPGHQTTNWPSGELVCDRYGSELDLCIVVGNTCPWRATYRVWTHQITDILHAGDIVKWHWQRYYSFLPAADVLTYAEGFHHRCVGMTLASANRLASRELYDIARAAGWHKLTLREQSALGLEGQWHNEETVLKARAHGRLNNGVGEHTTLSSSMAKHLEEWIDERHPKL
jgi:hypothetical protein